jgi:hypothetical protein
MVKNGEANLVAQAHSTLARWQNHFSQLLNVHWVNNVRQTEIQAAELLGPDSCAFRGWDGYWKAKRHKSPGTDPIPAEPIKVGGTTIHLEIHKLTNSVWHKEKLPEQWKEFIIVPIYKKGDTRDCSNFRGKSLSSTTYKILSNILLSRLTPYAENIFGDHQYEYRHNNNYWSYSLYSSNTWEKMEIADVADAVPLFRLLANLRIQLGGSSCIRF